MQSSRPSCDETLYLTIADAVFPVAVSGVNLKGPRRLA